MSDTFTRLLRNQFEATFCTLNSCIDKCPEAAWEAPVGNLLFCQVAISHTFFADYYLGTDPKSFEQQTFHRENSDFFRDYEELQCRKQQLLYVRAAIKVYLEHCRKKASEVLAKASADRNLPS